ncbi:MAG TPA: glycogen/starch/alpha-glucan phosphorylase [Streptosporangiaceae bacterium]|nr:glycogen/starch/alpha-glucan phosphorylase [Streptosporangiaceae bacterium]
MTPEGSEPKARWVGNTLAEFQRNLADNLCYQRGTTAESASAQDVYWTLAVTVRDRLADRRTRTARANYEANPKFVYYLSAEYMLGRQFRQNALYTGTAELARQASAASGYSAGELEDLDVEPGLGNGGLGRLAACLLDSLATLDVPAVGYGIRYEFGIFKQAFEDGQQVELPDDWTFYGNPWEFPAPDDLQVVGFYGHTEAVDDDQGGLRARWAPGEMVRGEPSHMLVPGYGTETVNILRLWRARAGRESFDLGLFNDGRYAEAVAAQMRSENLTKVLYPNDSTEAGRELRLKQQYFLVCCSLRDIIRRFRFRNSDWEAFPDKVVIQLNDTHPVLAIPELMRLLVDEHGIGWEQAWSITRRTFAYTCHTLLPEALETWPVPMFGRLLPRHLEIIYALNRFFLEDIRARYPGDSGRLARMSLIQEGPEHRVRMANLAVVGSFAVNGVAELQSRLLAATTLHDFADLWPEKFLNVTNGVSPRRFLRLANPRLSGLITDRLGDDRWLTDLERLGELEAFADDEQFRAQWREVKRQNKIDLAFHVMAATGIVVDPASLFDVMVKRLHEYKRQFLKLLHIITVYNRIKADPAAAVTPCTVIFGAKAAPSYQQAKRIIKLINSVAAVVNADPDVAGRIKVVFMPDYNVSVAELVVAAGNVSEQISLAGKEASGTGNMKLALNGALTVGTLDGANIEIRDRVGADNFFLFGVTADQAVAIRQGGYSPRAWYEGDPELKAAIDALASGALSGGDHDAVEPVLSSILDWDEYLVLADYRSYVDCHDRAVGPAWADQDHWTHVSILNTARSGFFSSDRTVRDYTRDIWHTPPVTPYSAADPEVPARVPER